MKKTIIIVISILLILFGIYCIMPKNAKNDNIEFIVFSTNSYEDSKIKYIANYKNHLVYYQNEQFELRIKSNNEIENFSKALNNKKVNLDSILNMAISTQKTNVSTNYIYKNFQIIKCENNKDINNIIVGSLEMKENNYCNN